LQYVTGIRDTCLEQPATDNAMHNNAQIKRTKFTPNKQTPPFKKTKILRFPKSFFSLL